MPLRPVSVRCLLVAALVASLGALAMVADAQVRKQDEGLVPNVDFPDRYDINDEPFPDRPLTPVAEVVRLGRGPIPMVLIPGVGADWTIWRAFMERNSGLYTMYAVTLPGFGGSQPPPAEDEEDFGNLPYMRNAVKAIVDLIDKAGIDKPVLMGQGMGGHLAAWIGARYPDKARAVISADGPPLIPFVIPETDDDRGMRREHIGISMFRPLTTDSEEDWHRRMETTAFEQVTDGQRGQEIQRMYLNCFRGVFVIAQFEFMMSDLRKPMATMSVPTLMIASAPPERIIGANTLRDRWLQILNDARNTTFIMMRDARHYMMDDMPEVFDNLVRRFVYGLPIDDAYISAGGTVKPENPELEKKAAEAQQNQDAKPDAAPQQP